MTCKVAVENDQLRLGAADNIDEAEVRPLTAVALDLFMKPRGSQVYFMLAADGSVISVLMGGYCTPIAASGMGSSDEIESRSSRS